MNTDRHTYLVTGAAGFIGNNICTELLSRSDTESVIAIDNITDYYSITIKKNRLSLLEKYTNCFFYNASILSSVTVQKIIDRHKPTILIHAAAEVGVRNGEADPVKYFSTNVIGTVTVLEACKSHISHAVVFSSSSVYGNSERLPFNEKTNITMETPISTYGTSKLAMEMAVKNFFSRTEIPTTVVRPFSVYGPNGRPDMLPIKILISAFKNNPIEIYSPSKLSRDWTYIDDFIFMFMPLLQNPTGFRVFNIGSGKPILLKTVVDIAKTELNNRGLSLHYNIQSASETEMLQTWADNSKILTLSKLVSLRSFKSGFHNTAEFFFSHKDLYV